LEIAVICSKGTGTVTSGTQAWEQRWHPLREEWVVVAAHRQDRPWQGERATVSPPPVPEHVGDCYFCPRNLRVSGARNPDYGSVFVFDNDHPCVGAEAPQTLERPSGLYLNTPASGVARVVCYTPKHNLTLAELPVDQIVALLDTWRDQYLELGARPEVRHVLTFENKGEVVGVSNPHPHGHGVRAAEPHDGAFPELLFDLANGQVHGFGAFLVGPVLSFHFLRAVCSVGTFCGCCHGTPRNRATKGGDTGRTGRDDRSVPGGCQAKMRQHQSISFSPTMG
jgi:hypothetical protein